MGRHGQGGISLKLLRKRPLAPGGGRAQPDEEQARQRPSSRVPKAAGRKSKHPEEPPRRRPQGRGTDVQSRSSKQNGERARLGCCFPRPRGKLRSAGLLSARPRLPELAARARPATPEACVLLNFGSRLQSRSLPMNLWSVLPASCRQGGSLVLPTRCR